MVVKKLLFGLMKIAGVNVLGVYKMRDKLSIDELEKINNDFRNKLNLFQREYTDVNKFEEEVSKLYKFYI